MIFNFSNPESRDCADATLKILGREKVTLVNGCFDLLHHGHVRFLKLASAFTKFLVVGLNSDQSVSVLKRGRPIFNHYFRAELLASMRFVHMVIIFDETKPDNLLKFVCPAVFAKSTEYRNKDLDEFRIAKAIGARVEFVEPTQDVSTSGILYNLQRPTIQAALRFKEALDKAELKPDSVLKTSFAAFDAAYNEGFVPEQCWREIFSKGCGECQIGEVKIEVQPDVVST